MAKIHEIEQVIVSREIEVPVEMKGLSSLAATLFLLEQRSCRPEFDRQRKQIRKLPKECEKSQCSF
jgi:hypothetical protein